MLVAAWAAAVVVLGAAPMAMAQASPQADPIIAQAIAGSYASLDLPAPAFRLTDQDGASVSLAGLRGKVVLLTFLDPVCTSDCPLIAQEFRQADRVLGGQSRHVELVAIVANPLYRELAYTRAFDRQESLTGLPNWRYLTGAGRAAEPGLARVRRPAWGRAGRRHGRPPGHRVRHQRPRAHPGRAGLRPRSRHGQLGLVVRRRADRRRPAGPAVAMSAQPDAGRVAASAGWPRRSGGLGAARLAGAAAAAGPPAGLPPAPPLALSLRRRGRHQLGGPRDGRRGAQDENFWQVFVRPAGAAAWRLATPAGVADNGGLVVASTGADALLAGFRPSQDLTFSPLAVTADAGTRWARAARSAPASADVPGALAAGPGGRLSR